MKSGTRQSRGLNYKGFAEAKPASAGCGEARRIRTMAAREKVGEPEFVAFVGIDWADQKHVWCLQAANSAKREGGELEHKPEVVEGLGQ